MMKVVWYQTPWCYLTKIEKDIADENRGEKETNLMNGQIFIGFHICRIEKVGTLLHLSV